MKSEDSISVCININESVVRVAPVHSTHRLASDTWQNKKEADREDQEDQDNGEEVGAKDKGGSL